MPHWRIWIRQPSSARELYTNARKDKADEIASWDDTTFLNKAKITIGKITQQVVYREERRLIPAVAKTFGFCADRIMSSAIT